MLVRFYKNEVLELRDLRGERVEHVTLGTNTKMSN